MLKKDLARLCQCGTELKYIELSERINKLSGELVLIEVYMCPSCNDTFYIDMEAK